MRKVLAVTVLCGAVGGCDGGDAERRGGLTRDEARVEAVRRCPSLGERPECRPVTDGWVCESPTNAVGLRGSGIATIKSPC
ncbi:hypothetical protein C7Y72_01335 [Paraconexibacter algicola]|uniref:Uncharacterized protein n=1 Tax=Paraconexibacter algicola TaxID=2133960 RepID=A0A2T4UGL2_9ACTN|nr:hypothetical protein C7Y72_01335 [Paraconexibacter algicola]